MAELLIFFDRRVGVTAQRLSPTEFDGMRKNVGANRMRFVFAVFSRTIAFFHQQYHSENQFFAGFRGPPRDRRVVALGQCV